MISAMRTLQNVAETAELRVAGVTRVQIERALEGGVILRVRRGWFATPDADPQIVAAARIGGRLACVSAATFHGWATPLSHTLHVVVPPHASRLRTSADARVVVHWNDGRRNPSRLVTSRRDTVVQLALCLDADHAGAAFDSILQRTTVTPKELDDWLSDVPDHILRTLATRSELCESFLESIGRIRLERAGITGQHQVRISGVGRVDLLVDGWLIIEWDGLAHHDNAGAHDEDCRRDAWLATIGYRVLRFSYALVMNEWFLVLGAIRSALDGVSRQP